MQDNPILALSQLKEEQSRAIQSEEVQNSLLTTNPLIGAGGLLDELNDHQQRLLIAKMYGGSDASAARAAKVNYSTLQGWKANDEAFKQVYKMVTEMPVQMASQVSAFAFAKAVDKIVTLMDAQNIAVQQWAIEKMLGIASVGKQRIEVTHRSEGANDDDVDAILDRVEKRRAERADPDGTSGGNSSV